MKIKITCSNCGNDDDWEDFAEMAQVNAQMGSKPRIILVGSCICGNDQEVADITE
mgnify:CR=1 FL=1|tara:strand:- start:1811 stop:1975 length:165 start_codon:yes stop_codon:yes gene_type:complete